MISAMMGIGAFLFLLFYIIQKKKVLLSLEALFSMVLGYILIGVWLIPALSGGLVGMDAEASTSVMKALTYNILDTLDPINRLTGIVDTFYYGISIFMISCVGIFLATKKNKSGYYLNILIIIFTTPAVVPILSKLPLSQLLWMMRFATIAYAFFLWSFIEWKNARKFFTILLMMVLLIDLIPSFMLYRYYTQSSGRINDELEIVEDITSSRVSVLDLSAYGSYPSWELCEGENPVPYTFGWAWQGAATAPNIVMLNTALEKGYYDLLFDRSIELGNDTVVIRKELIQKANKTQEEMELAAEKSKYFLYKETNQTLIFHRDTNGDFGVVTDYTGFAIGKYANQIVLPYPSITTGVSRNIQDYEISELMKYEIIYLSGFEYYNLEDAEKMVDELGKKGIKVIIDMAHIPVVEGTNREHFLGVFAQDVSFTSMFPTLNYENEEYFGTNFPSEYTQWNTKYIEGVTNVLGSAYYSDQDLAFAGTNENENVIFIGFNLLFYSMETDDKGMFELVSEFMGVELNSLPKRELVELDINYNNKEITIDTEIEGVNTTLAYQDIFVSQDNILNQNNLLIVENKHTVIELTYPHLKVGMITSGTGVLLIFVWLGVIYRIDYKRKSNKRRE